MKGKVIISLLLIVLVSIIEARQYVDPCNSNSVTLELIHRHAPQFNDDNRPKTQHQRLKDLVHHDIIRNDIIQSRTRRRRAQEENASKSTPAAAAVAASVQMPLSSGRAYGIGQYVTSFEVGTPPHEFRLIADTGSDLTWIRCRYPCSSGDRNCTRKETVKGKNVFDAPLSSSFSPVPCSSDMCKVGLSNLFSLKTCPTPSTPCAYHYTYKDDSAATGVFANETVTMGLPNGGKTSLHNVLIGCTDSSEGSPFENVDGIVGLANTKDSFATFAAGKFGGKFSYCLVDHITNSNATNYITFGSPDRDQVNATGNARSTHLELDAIPFYYGVNILGISIDDKMLEIPSKVWDIKEGGGMIIDSGNSLTVLAEPAYKVVMEALKKSVSMYERVKFDDVPMEYCFNATGFNETSVAKLMIHFKDGARFEPHWNSYLIAAAYRIRCIGFLPARFPSLSVIGNIIQQKYLWEFDLKGKKLGFVPGC